MSYTIIYPTIVDLDELATIEKKEEKPKKEISPKKEDSEVLAISNPIIEV